MTIRHRFATIALCGLVLVAISHGFSRDAQAYPGTSERLSALVCTDGVELIPLSGAEGSRIDMSRELGEIAMVNPVICLVDLIAPARVRVDFSTALVSIDGAAARQVLPGTVLVARRFVITYDGVRDPRLHIAFNTLTTYPRLADISERK
jgi:hypothetical protein